MNKPIIIAGPCGLESQEDARTIVKELTAMGINHIRGGIWKYRSDPHTYQGNEDAIRWMSDLKEEYTFKYYAEVFNVADALYCRNIIDVPQIGSRNMYNTDLLKNINDCPKGDVILKRHYCASLKEFVAHSNYLTKQNVIMCLRGALNIHPQEQRFIPDMADIPRLRELTKNPIMYDVSHSSCHKKYIEQNLKAALAYEPDYIMIEVHPDPKRALSDENQQLTIDEFRDMMNRLELI